LIGFCFPNVAYALRSEATEMKMSQSVPSVEQLRSVPQIKSSRQYFRIYEQLLARLPFDAIEQTAAELVRANEQDRRIFLFGNGGSAALASHFACDLGKGTIVDGNGHRRFRVLALTDNVPLLTAWANDSCYENVFAEQLRGFVMRGDVVLAISGSGNSSNVLRALEVGRDAGAVNIGLTGFRGGRMKDLCSPCIVIPSDNMQIIEDLHLSVSHAIFTVIRQRLTEAKCAEVAMGANASD
jgi:D-sedoheptulose 7-phosphate isomerase